MLVSEEREKRRPRTLYLLETIFDTVGIEMNINIDTGQIYHWPLGKSLAILWRMRYRAFDAEYPNPVMRGRDNIKFLHWHENIQVTNNIYDRERHWSRESSIPWFPLSIVVSIWIDSESPSIYRRRGKVEYEWEANSASLYFKISGLHDCLAVLGRCAQLNIETGVLIDPRDP